MTSILQPFYPQLAVVAGLVGVLMIPRAARLLAAAGILAGLAFLASHALSSPTDLLQRDGISTAWQALFMIAAVVLIALNRKSGELPMALSLGAVLGMQLLAVANHLFVLFLGFELMSLSTYLLIYNLRRDRVTPREEEYSLPAVPRAYSRAALEAAVKYFFSGGLAAGLYLFGMSIYYALTGSMNLPHAQSAVPGLELAVAFMGCAALFKLGAFPMNFWLPDVYEAAVPELTGFMSTAVKAAGFLLLIRLLGIVTLNPAPGLMESLPILAAATMTIANLLALRQDRLQRLLAYSSLAHAGYILAAVWAWAASGSPAGGTSTIFLYLAAYLAMNTGAFIFLNVTGLRDVSQLRGFGAKAPGLAAFFSLMILSLAGVPPMGGFLAKFFVIWDLLRVDNIWLPVAISLNSLFALGYYFRLIREMYFADADASTGREPQSIPAGAQALMLASAAATVAIGLTPVVHRWLTEWLSV